MPEMGDSAGIKVLPGMGDSAGRGEQRRRESDAGDGRQRRGRKRCRRWETVPVEESSAGGESCLRVWILPACEGSPGCLGELRMFEKRL